MDACAPRLHTVAELVDNDCSCDTGQGRPGSVIDDGERLSGQLPTVPFFFSSMYCTCTTLRCYQKESPFSKKDFSRLHDFGAGFDGEESILAGFVEYLASQERKIGAQHTIQLWVDHGCWISRMDGPDGSEFFRGPCIPSLPSHQQIHSYNRGLYSVLLYYYRAGKKR